MALIRPVVLIYQEIATPTINPATPDLNCLVVGPAYHIQDYYKPGTTDYADKADIKLTAAYGALEANIGVLPPVGPDYIVVAEPPSNAVGALLDGDSVKVFFDNARVLIEDGVGGVTSLATPNRITQTDGINFTTGPAKTIPGDRFLISDGSVTLKRSVYSVATLLTAPGLDFLVAGVVAGDLLTITNDANGTVRNGTYTVSVVVSATVVEVLPVPAIAAIATANATVAVTDSTGGTSKIAATAVVGLVSSTLLYLTQDIPATGYTVGAGQLWRVERRLNDQEVDSSFYSTNGNSISIDGGVTLTVPSQGLKTVEYADVYVQYISLRQDLQVLDVVFSKDEIEAKIGRIDARNPLAVGTFVSLQNTNSQVQFYGVASNDLIGHTDVRDAINTRPDVYAIVPLTSDVSVIAMWNADCLGLAIPDEIRGRPQRFRVVLGSGVLPTTLALVQPQSTGLIEQVTGTAPAAVTRLTIPGIASLITNGVLPGDKVVITLDVNGTSRDGTYTVSQVVSATVLEVEEAIPAAATANASVALFESDGVTVRIAITAIIGLISAAGDDLFLTLRDATGTFVSSGIIPGDLIEIPADTNSTLFTGTLSQFVIEAILSENRVRIVNNGANTSTVENELPHGVKRTAPTALVPTTAIIHYRVSRNLSKSGQVTQLVAQAQSFNSRRTILMWPDKVDVSGVVGGNLQAGYYLSCAVGGMTAGLPSHQGFTFLGIAGISQIYNSNTYFNDSQLTDLSQGGWYVFAQQTPTSLPFTIHQLTTDVSTLETGEFSVVKNFDFVALFFVDILDNFLGSYNINQETLTLLRSAITTGGETLRLRTLAKIGAPLTSFSIADLYVSPLSADRVVSHVLIGLPKPLNVIELHLVA
jgi:hypothetical protein